MSRRMTVFALLAVMAGVTVLSLPARAHHGTALWERDEVVQKGTVVEYFWRNPHVLITWNVKDDKGNVVEWTGELASPESLMADGGMTKDSLKPGDAVIMYVRVAKSGTPHSVIDQIKRGDGSMVLAYSRQGGGTQQDRDAREKARAEAEKSGK